MKSGAAIVEMPMPTPPMKRATMNEPTSQASPEPIADTTYRIPLKIRIFRRPHLLVGIPPKQAPSTVPHSAELSAQPCIVPLRAQRS